MIFGKDRITAFSAPNRSSEALRSHSDSAWDEIATVTQNLSHCGTRTQAME